MKIIRWNCNGAFRKKFENLLKYQADIYVIQECENPLETIDFKYKSWAQNYLWIGDSKNKGLGVFASEEIELKKLDWTNIYTNHKVKHFLPCRINNMTDLLAVWTHRNNSPNFGYIGQFWKYLQLNKNKINETIIAGDFNSNAIWDEWDRWWNHTDVVLELKELGLESIYHHLYKEEQGNETVPTLYFQKNILKKYHIDYIFSPSNSKYLVENIEIGVPEDWLVFSDHMPIICEISINTEN